MNGKLLITGGSGFVAYHIICRALQEGLEVHASTRPSSKTTHLKDLDIHYLSLDFADTASMQKILEENQYNYIIHAAGSTSASSQQQYDLVNAVFTSNLAKAAITAGITLKKFVFLSSLAAVGPCREGIIDDKMSMQPVTGYGKSKLLAEQMLKKQQGLPLIIFRPTAVYGPREKNLLLVFKTINQGLEPYIGRNKQDLSFVYVKDLANVVIRSLDSAISGKAYNISDGKVYDRYELASITKSIIHKKTIRLHFPVGVMKVIAGLLEAAGSLKKNTPALNRDKIAELIASWPCNIDPAKADLNFNPAYNLQAGLEETLEWYLENKWL